MVAAARGGGLDIPLARYSVSEPHRKTPKRSGGVGGGGEHTCGAEPFPLTLPEKACPNPPNQEAIATLLAPSGCGVGPLVVGGSSVSHHRFSLFFILLGEDDFCAVRRVSDGGLS